MAANENDSRPWNDDHVSHPKTLPVGDVYRGQAASNYVAHRSGEEQWQLEQDAVRTFLSEFAAETEVLDAPVGTGRFFQFYLAQSLNVTGIDISEDMIAEARLCADGVGLPVQLHVGSADALPYEDNSFDLVVCCRFIPYHVSTTTAKMVLQEFARVSRRHVLLWLSVRHDGVERPGLPKPWECLGSNLYRAELLQFLKEAGLAFVRESSPIKVRSPEKHEYFWLCTKT